MKYRRLYLELSDYPERLNRELLVKEDIDLIELGCVILTSIKSEFEHLFEYQVSEKRFYVPDIFLEDPYLESLPMKQYNLSDLPENFAFVYDTGANYCFNCYLATKAIELTDKKGAIIIDGIGDGIWEDNKSSLELYFEEQIKLETSENDEELGFYMPWDKKYKQVGDYDNYDIERENIYFYKKCSSNYRKYLSEMQKAGYEHKDELYSEEKYLEA